MRKNKYDERAVCVLMDAFGSLQRHASHFVQEKNRRRRRQKRFSVNSGKSVIQEKHGSYVFIPNSPYVVLPQLIYVFDYLNRVEQKYKYGFSFLDAGCGVGNIMMLARAVGFEVHGLEIDPITIEFAAVINPYWQQIKQQNVLTYNSYGKFDVVYYYCPFSCKKEIEFEERVENQMKVGAVLIANMKQSSAIIRDKRFRRVTFKGSGFPHAIYKKVKK